MQGLQSSSAALTCWPRLILMTGGSVAKVEPSPMPLPAQTRTADRDIGRFDWIHANIPDQRANRAVDPAA